MNKADRFASCAPKDQGGAVLIIGLIMVLLMTIVGLAAIRGSGLQETMAGNMRESNLAFQAAEAGLREGEGTIGDVINNPFDGSTAGLNPDLNKTEDATPVARWQPEDWEGEAILADIELSNVREENLPRYAIEKLDVSEQDKRRMLGCSIDPEEICPEIDFFRISSRGVGGTADSSAIVQTTYAHKK